MSASVLIGTHEAELLVPSEATASLAAFRAWALSDDSPDTGRFDYISGRIEVSDTAGKELDAHGALKGEIYTAILIRAKAIGLGKVYTGSVRVTCSAALLSAEPDVVLLTYESIESGRVQRVPKAGNEPHRYVEIEGAPELVVEVVSDSTVRKDMVRLPQAYFDAGVKEYWLADGRKKDLTFVIHTRGPEGCQPVQCDEGGYQRSSVLEQFCRLERSLDRVQAWQFDLLFR